MTRKTRPPARHAGRGVFYYRAVFYFSFSGLLHSAYSSSSTAIARAAAGHELRTFPGPDMGPGVELLTATMRHYQQITGRQLSLAV